MLSHPTVWAKTVFDTHIRHIFKMPEIICTIFVKLRRFILDRAVKSVFINYTLSLNLKRATLFRTTTPVFLGGFYKELHIK